MNCFARMVNFSFSWTISVTYKCGVSEGSHLESYDSVYITTEAPYGVNCQVLISRMFVSSPRDLV